MRYHRGRSLTSSSWLESSSLYSDMRSSMIISRTSMGKDELDIVGMISVVEVEDD